METIYLLATLTSRCSAEASLHISQTFFHRDFETLCRLHGYCKLLVSGPVCSLHALPLHLLNLRVGIVIFLTQYAFGI